MSVKKPRHDSRVDHYRARVSEKMRRVPHAVDSYRSRLHQMRVTWNDRRTFQDVSQSLYKNVGIDLGRELVSLGKKGVVTVLEDGPGINGSFTAGLKHFLLGKAAVHVTALAAHDSSSLRLPESGIDELHVGLAEEKFPRRKFSFIHSSFGSIQYALPAWRKEHLLTFAHSLEKGGLMVVQFSLSSFPGHASIPYTLSHGTSANELARRRKENDWVEPWKREMSKITRLFEKQGFSAQFKSVGPIVPEDMNDFWLIVRRPK